jgi:hypothetical protein
MSPFQSLLKREHLRSVVFLLYNILPTSTLRVKYRLPRSGRAKASSRKARHGFLYPTHSGTLGPAIQNNIYQPVF